MVFAANVTPQLVHFYGVDVEDVSVSQLAQLVLRDVQASSFVLAPEVYADKRSVSVNLSAKPADFNRVITAYFKSLGYDLALRDKVAFLAPTPEFKAPELSRQTFVYEPRFRDVSYLVNSVGGLFEGRFSTQHVSAASAPSGDVAPVGSSASYSTSSARALQTNASDVLVFYGLPEEVARLKSLLAAVDVPAGDLQIDATVYEVQTTKKDGSALKLAVNLLSSQFSLGFNQSVAVADTFLRFSNKNVDAVLSALNSDSRFKVVSSPTVRVRSGSAATFTSGAQVPVLSSTTTTGQGATVQSVEYRDSGVIFTVRPNIRLETIDLDLTQELSNFVTTTTGVNTSPTLNKRSLNSSISVRGGDTILIGGLTMDQETRNKSGFSFLPSFTDSLTHDNDRTEILLLLHVVPLKPLPTGDHAAPRERGAGSPEGKRS